MSTSSDKRVGLYAENLTIILPNGRRLLDGASLKIEPGEFVLLIGPSGSGKTTLLRHIAGLVDSENGAIRISGDVTIGCEQNDESDDPSIGLVFQNLALFDELTAVDNVRFAIDHRLAATRGGRDEAQEILRELGVPIPGRLDRLSGGERQRVAVARTLAFQPLLLLFDEPTGGLDPILAKDVAGLIAHTHKKHGKTTVVVTHDYAPFLEHEPRLLLLDDREAKLREVSESQLNDFFRQTPSDASANRRTVAPPTGYRENRAWQWLRAPGEVAWTILAAPAAMCRGWHRPKWKFRYLWHYFRMVLLGTTAIYVALAGAMLGFVFTSFSFSRLPYTEVMMPLLTEEFLAATGYTTFRVVVPLMVGVLIAGKCGAAVAADVGARRLTHQFDALQSFRVRPDSYLYGNIAIALIIGCPLLTAVAFATNCLAALVAFLMASPDTTVSMFYRNFFATTWWPAGHLFPNGTGWVLIKASGEGLLIAALGYGLGSRRKASSPDVSRDVGLTIFWGSLAVLLLHAVFSFIEF